MILQILLFFLSTLLGYYIYRGKQIHDHFKRNGVKFVPGVPLFGNIWKSSTLQKHLVEVMMDVYGAFPDEKYVGFIQLTMPVVMIRDPELIKKVTVKDFDHFSEHREFFSDETDPLFTNSLLLMKGSRWRKMRTTLSPAFTASKLKYMLPLIVENTNNIIEFLNENQSQNIEVDDLARRYTSDVIASAGFGLKVNSVKDRDNKFYMAGYRIFLFGLWQRLFIMLITKFPGFSRKIGIRFFPQKTYDFFQNLTLSTMEYRKKENIERPDIIQILMDSPEEWTKEELMGQVFLYFISGYETTASTLVMSIHELALNPEAQEKAYQEIRLFNKEKEINFDTLSELKCLDKIIYETLRKWCPAIMMDRICVKPYELPPPREGGKPYMVKPGDVVYNMVNCLHMDPNNFPDPNTFDPERFSDSNKDKIKPFTYMPFGTGPRNCTGTRLVMMELKVLLFNILLNFKIVKSEKTMDPIVLRAHNFNIRARNGCWVKFEKRK